jgi:hypothetical protein
MIDKENNRMKSRNLMCLPSVVALILPLGMWGCDRPADKAAAPAAKEAQSADVLPANLFLSSPPEGARGVGEVKADPTAKDAVVIHGRIGGRKEPFLEGSAMFLLVDSKIKTCFELHGKGCPTPWDYCCEPKDALLANTATVQVVGADGRPLRLGLAGISGLDPTREVVVTGTIAPRENTDTLVINAVGIYVTPAGG